MAQTAPPPAGSGLDFLLTRASPYPNDKGKPPFALPNGYHKPGNECLTSLAEAKVLVVGAGGLGCEILKDLALVGFRDIHVIDMDTIDVTNLNRQFLFRIPDVGQYKATVAARFIENRVPGCSVTPYTCMIQEKPDEFYRQFNVVVAGLDNIKARCWLSSKLLEFAEIDEDGDLEDDAQVIPMIDGGTEGLRGQVHVIIPRVTKCFNCVQLAMGGTKRKAFQICTVANEPRSPEHCIEFVKLAIDDSLDKSRPDVQVIREAWTKLNGGDSRTSVDTDSPEHMQFICTHAQARAAQFDIEGVDYTLTMGVVKSIIPAIAATNALISAACAHEALKIVTFASQTMSDYMLYNAAGEVVNASVSVVAKVETCPVCTMTTAHFEMGPDTTLHALRTRVAGRFKVPEQGISINLAEGAPLLWASGPLAKMTASNLPLMLRDLGFGTDATEVACSCKMSDEQGGGSVQFRAKVRLRPGASPAS